VRTLSNRCTARCLCCPVVPSTLARRPNNGSMVVRRRCKHHTFSGCLMNW
jgi:hypothetical protein